MNERKIAARLIASALAKQLESELSPQEIQAIMDRKVALETAKFELAQATLHGAKFAAKRLS